MNPKNPSNEIRITRVYEAPLKTVWEAWTDPKQAAQWWGPRGFTLTTHSKDLRPGGTWHYTMHGPDGTDYVNKTLYHEVETHSMLVYDHGGNDERAPLFRVTVFFSEVPEGTKMEMSMRLPSPEAAEETRKLIKKAGGGATWDRLAEYLAKATQDKDRFVIHRSFDAPRELLFEMWSDPKHFSQWLAPTGFRMEFLQADIRPGGKTFYFMTNDQGVDMYGKAEYLEVQKPRLLLYTQQFCDRDGKISRHPHAPTWPETMLTTVKLDAEAKSQTRITLTWDAFGKTTREELETFLKSRAGMTQGWTGSFDKLDEYLLKNWADGDMLGLHSRK